MSIFSKIGGMVKGAVTGYSQGGFYGALAGAAGGAMSNKQQSGAKPKTSMSGLPALPLPGGGGFYGGGGGMGGFIGAAGRAIGGAAKGAASLCSKYPVWCAGIGGVAAVSQMMQSGQLPMPRRRRRRGITARDLSSFRRVANLVDHYAKPVHHMRNFKRRAR